MEPRPCMELDSSTDETFSLLSKSNSHIYNQKRCFKYCRTCCIPFKGAIVVLLWSALLHSAGLFVNLTLSSHTITNNITFTRFSMAFVQSAKILIFLLYPVAGLLAETLFMRLKFMIAATIIAIIGLLFLFASSVTFIISYSSVIPTYYQVLLVIGLIVHQIGLGMFEANAIQFGVDQLQFASNEELSKFVHWYYWSVYCVKVIVSLYIVGNIVPSFTSELHLNHYILVNEYVLLVQIVFSLLCISVSLGIVVYCVVYHHLIIEPTSKHNPVTLIWKVINYIIHHSQPVRRSAFTYGDPPPSRLDIAKERYGGPFTTEQVEDVKSFWKVLGLLVTLFGKLLSTNIFINLGIIQIDLSYATEHRVSLSALITYNQHIYYPTIALCIPIYMCILRPCFIRSSRLGGISMLKKMGLGLFMIVITLGLATVSSAMMYEGFDGEQCRTWNVSAENRSLKWSGSIEKEITHVALPIAQVFYALGCILVSLTALEFIIAQAPRTMQGLLIGLWYAYQSVGDITFLTTALTQEKINCHYWPYIFLTVICVVSLCLYSVVSYWFKYRERQEFTNINYQAIIEDYTARHLQQSKQEQVKILDTSVDIIINDKS